MSNTVGSISIEMLANLAGMVSDMGRAQQDSARAAKEMQRQWQESLDGIEEGFRSVADLFGLGLSLEGIKGAIEGIAELEKQALETAETITNLSQTLGVSIPTLQTVGYAAGLVGGNMDTATNALTRLERAAAEANAGNQKLAADFQAIGINATQLAQLLQNPDDLIRVVTQHLAEFADGADKTAVEIALMGRGAGAVVPLINELGENWKGLNEEALKFAGVTETDVLAMAQSQRGINQVNQEIAGLRAAFAVELLPAVDAATAHVKEFAESDATRSAIHSFGDAVKYVVDNFRDVASTLASGGLGAAISKVFVEGTQDGLNFKNTILIGWAEIQREGEIAWAAVEQAARVSMVAIEHYLADVIAGMSNAALFTGQVDLARQLAATSEQFKAAAVDTTAYKTAVASANDTFNNYVANLKVTVGAEKDHVTVMDTMVVTADSAAKKHIDLADAMAKSHESMVALTGEMAKWNEENDKLAGSIGSPLVAAEEAFNASMEKATEELINMIGNGLSLADAYDLLATRIDLSTQAMWNSIAADVTKNDKADDYIQKLINEGNALAAVTDSQKAAAEFDKIAAQNLLTLHDAHGIVHDSIEDTVKANADLRQSFIDSATEQMSYNDLLKQSQEVLKQWEQIASSAFDSAFSTINKDIIEGGNVMHDLVSVAKTVVEQILLEFEKLVIINPILNQIFGLSGSNALPTSSIGGILNNIGALFGGGGSASADGSSGGFGGISNLWSGFNNLTGGAGNNFVNGIGNFLGFGGTNLGGEGVLAGFGSSDAFAGATASISGSDDLLGTLGLSDYSDVGAGAAAGSSFLSTLGPMMGAFGLGERLGGGGTTGAAAGIGLAAAAYFVPVVGWIAGALMLIDTFSGGNLFGGPKKPWDSSFEVDLTGGGIGEIAMQQFKKKGALFSGNSYSWQNEPVDQQTQNMWSQFFTQVQSAADKEAQVFGESTGEVITGSWKEVTDHTGKVISQTTTILGQTFQESIQDFQKRVMADTLLANMGGASAEAQQIAQQWQGSAQNLLDGAQFLVAAETDIAKGHALVQGDTLTQLTAFVQGMQQQGESLIQTYVRIEAETKEVNSVFDQFGATMTKSGEALVTFDDAVTQAFGGLQNFSQEMSQVFSDIFSGPQQLAAKTAYDKTNAQAALTGLGLDPNESYADFQQQAQYVFEHPDLFTPDQIKQWADATLLMAAWNNDIEQNAQVTQNAINAQRQAQANYDQFMTPFRLLTDGLDGFEHSMENLGTQLTTNIDNANALAQAAGLQGVSASDAAKIIEVSAMQGAAAIQQLEQQAAQLTDQLYGSGYISQLQQQLKDAQAAGIPTYDIRQAIAEAQAAQQQHAQDTRYLEATQLAQEVGEIAAFTGESLDQVAKQLGIPMDAFAKDMHMTKDQLTTYLTNRETAALATIKSADLLQDIRDILEGKPLTYTDGTDFGTQPKPSAHGYSPPGGGSAQPAVKSYYAPTTGVPQPVSSSPDTMDQSNNADPVTAAVTQGTSQEARDMSENNRLLREQNELLREILGRKILDPRSQRHGAYA